MKKSSSSMILYCLLNRLPIIILGDESSNVDDFLIELSELMHFRKDLVFYTDFISLEEYQQLLQNEDIDYNTQRTQVRCPCSVSNKSLMQFNHFDSWIIGLETINEKNHIKTLNNFVRSKIPVFLEIKFFSDSISVDLVGLNEKEIDLAFEQNVLQKISQDTEKSVIKMKRVLSERIKSENIDKDLIANLLDFEVEKQELKKNILKSEIQNFFSGSKRAFFILSRMHLMNGFEMNARIGSKTLLETIDYYDASIERIITFIYKEWGEDFSEIFENGKKANALDRMQSLWG
ncbi:MAG: hypothetical protein EU535_07610 [Promethearchaeota archaeon]|nr:MAG: hypothetical protein EU535_07610 [Candidatus Lokiarchaeota archaeon]